MTMVDPERLIMVIENYPCIWNTFLKDYENRNLKDASWNKVCEDLLNDWVTLSQEEKNLKLNYVKKRWHNIRDYYKKEIDQQRNVQKRRQPLKKRRKYVFSNILEYLRPVLERKNTTGNYENTEDELDELEDDKSITISTLTSPNSTPAVSKNSIIASTRDALTHKTKKTPAKLNAFESSIVKALENANTNMAVPESHFLPVEDDPDLLFLKSLLPDMKAMIAGQKIDFKIGVMQLIRSIRASSPQSPP